MEDAGPKAQVVVIAQRGDDGGTSLSTGRSWKTARCKPEGDGLSEAEGEGGEGRAVHADISRSPMRTDAAAR